MLAATATQPLDVWLSRGASVATVLAALVAVLAAWYAYEQWQVAKGVREEANRPYVIVDLVEDPHDRHWLQFEIKNISSAPAKDIHFAFDPPLSTAEDFGGYPPEKASIWTDGLSWLAPGRVMTFLFDSSVERHRQGLPRQYRLTATYTDSRGTPYREESILDLGALLGGSVFFTRYSVHHGVQELKKLNKRLAPPPAKGIKAILDTLDPRPSTPRPSPPDSGTTGSPAAP